MSLFFYFILNIYFFNKQILAPLSNFVIRIFLTFFAKNCNIKIEFIHEYILDFKKFNLKIKFRKFLNLLIFNLKAKLNIAIIEEVILL